MIPMGCQQRATGPRPDNALQATYGHRDSGAYAVALRLRFRTPERALGLAAAHRRDLESCRDQPPDPISAAPAPVLSVTGGARRYTVEYRLVGERTIWRRALSARGRDVVTLDTEPPGAVSWTGRRWDTARREPARNRRAPETRAP